MDVPNGEVVGVCEVVEKLEREVVVVGEVVEEPKVEAVVV
jgi:hypothetical protein